MTLKVEARYNLNELNKSERDKFYTELQKNVEYLPETNLDLNGRMETFCGYLHYSDTLLLTVKYEVKDITYFRHYENIHRTIDVISFSIYNNFPLHQQEIYDIELFKQYREVLNIMIV